MEGLWVHRRQPRPPFDEHVDREWLTLEGNQKSDRPTVSSHGHSFAVSNTVNHVPTVVAQFTNRDLTHLDSVSRVIHARQTLH